MTSFSTFQNTGTGATHIATQGGNDLIEATDGADTIDAGAGDDQVAGFGGDDFVLLGSGVIPSLDGSDVVIRSYQSATYDPFADMTETAEGTLISYATDASILLEGVALADLTTANIVVEDPGLIFA